jgi:hypothetical protein
MLYSVCSVTRMTLYLYVLDIQCINPLYAGVLPVCEEGLCLTDYKQNVLIYFLK